MEWMAPVSAMKKKIVVIDHQESVRELLCQYLERSPKYEVVGQAGTGLEAIRVLETTFANVLVLELLLPELCGQEVISRARREIPGIRIVVFTGASETSVLANALRSEPECMVHKSEALDVFLVALHTASVGGRFFSPKVNCLVAHSECGAAQFLSAREIEVMQSIAEGKSSKEIGRLLGVATKTVESHRTHLMQKLDIHNAASLTRVAVQMGIVPSSWVPGDGSFWKAMAVMLTLFESLKAFELVA
jgi:DNA-binding NarL/FixJ family response regulator